MAYFPSKLQLLEQQVFKTTNVPSHDKDRGLCLGEKGNNYSVLSELLGAVHLFSIAVSSEKLTSNKKLPFEQHIQSQWVYLSNWFHLTGNILQQYLGLIEAYSLVQRANLAVCASSEHLSKTM